MIDCEQEEDDVNYRTNVFYQIPIIALLKIAAVWPRAL